jgi:hypothetical protein
MGKNAGIIYSLSNLHWDNKLKCGLTRIDLKKRISNLQTSLFYDCEIISFTDILINCKIYEYLLKKILCNYRIRKDREFFDIEPEEIKEIFESFNYINSILNTEKKLNEYMINNHPEYYKKSKKRLYSEFCLSNSESFNDENPRKKLKGLYIDTSCL